MTDVAPKPCEGFFDAEFYQTQMSRRVPDALAHFRAHGDRQGLDPSPYFSTLFYKQTYPDWADGGQPTALDDFLMQDARGPWRHPHPMIDPDFYLRQHADVAAAGMSPLGHFARHGDLEGRSPSAAFDARFYQRRYLRLAQTLAFAHYRSVGQTAGHLPRPEPRSFDQSAAASAGICASLNRPILLGGHDAQEAGSPILIRDIAREMIARGRDVVFVLRDGGPLVQALQQLGPVFVLADGWDAAGLFSGFGADVPANLHSAEAARMAIAAAKAGLRTTLHVHEMRGYLETQDLVPDLKAAQGAGVRLIASFPRMAADLRSALGALTIMQPGVTLPPAPLRAFRHQRQTRVGKAVFIGAGYADRRKGFDLFVEAAADLHKVVPDAGFVWLGALDPWAQELADKAIAKGLPLCLPGFVSDPLCWYAAASVYLLTSREDPGPTTLIHAAATGIPFVGYQTDIGLRGIIDPLGQFVTVGDRQAFVAAALGHLKNDTPARRHRQRALLRPHLGFERYCDGLLRLFA